MDSELAFLIEDIGFRRHSVVGVKFGASKDFISATWPRMPVSRSSFPVTTAMFSPSSDNTNKCLGLYVKSAVRPRLKLRGCPAVDVVNLAGVSRWHPLDPTRQNHERSFGVCLPPRVAPGDKARGTEVRANEG